MEEELHQVDDANGTQLPNGDFFSYNQSAIELNDTDARRNLIYRLSVFHYCVEQAIKHR